MQPENNPAHGDDISVWVVDDHLDFRETVEDVLNATDGMTCLQTFASCEEVLEAAIHDSLPDILLLDISFPDQMSGIEGVRLFRAQAPDVRVVMLSMYLEDDIVFDALYAGAHAFVFKMTPPEQILETIRTTHAGTITLTPQIAHRVFSTLNTPSKKNPQSPLLEQETQILQGLMQGKSQEKLAKELQLPLTTLYSLLASILRKLHHA